MKSAEINGVTLVYEAVGSGEPLLLISPFLADGFLPFLAEPALAERYRLIRYHRRGWADSTPTPGPVSVAEHAADGAALLRHLDIPRAHVAGHSSGAAVALQMGLDHATVVHTLCLLEPSLLPVPSAEVFFKAAQPAFDAYKAGRHEAAVGMFLSLVSGLDWETCRALLEERIPGSVAQCIKDANTFFGVELPGVGQWVFGADQAAKIRQPALSVLGTQTEPVWVEIAERLRSWLPNVEEQTIDSAGHLLHIQRPTVVARGIADFLARNAMPRADAVQPHNQKAAATWSSGGASYEGISRMISDSIEHCIFRLAPRAGERVLDLACGTGWASRSVARQHPGVKLFGIDIGADLIDVAKAKAKAVTASIDYRVGDAEKLPFEDGYFDAVISTCGIMFAGKPEAAAAELIRVTKPGARIGLTTWKPDSEVMELFKVMKRYLPAPPTPPPASPFAWGASERVTELLGGGFNLKFEEAVSVFRFATAEDAWLAWSTTYGPSKALASSLDPERREAFHEDMVAFHEKDRNELGIAKYSKYMLTIGTRK